MHISKHIKEFISIDGYNYTISNISKIIKIPDFVYYNKNKNSLLYFKKLYENICVVVKLNLRKNKDIYVASVYPVNKRKIEKLKELSYIVDI